MFNFQFRSKLFTFGFIKTYQMQLFIDLKIEINLKIPNIYINSTKFASNFLFFDNHLLILYYQICLNALIYYYPTKYNQKTIIYNLINLKYAILDN
jgi:hypothetical protein